MVARVQRLPQSYRAVIGEEPSVVSGIPHFNAVEQHLEVGRDLISIPAGMGQDGHAALRLYETRDLGRILGIGVAIDAQRKKVETIIAGELEAWNHEERGIRETAALVDEIGHFVRIKRIRVLTHSDKSVAARSPKARNLGQGVLTIIGEVGVNMQNPDVRHPCTRISLDAQNNV